MKTLKLFFSFCFLASSAFAGFIDGSRISYGNWTGGAYFSEETGLFSHCAVSARYLTGNTLFFSLTREYSLNVGVQIQEPLFKDYREFQTTVKIDKFDAVFSNATVIDDYFAMVTMPNLDIALDQIKRGRTLSINSKFGQVPFDLTGTFRVLDKTYSCARNYYNYQANSKTRSASSSSNFDQSITEKT